MDRETPLDFERLDVYHLARQLVRECSALIRRLPGGRADMVDQLRRCCLSIPLNIAEGSGEFAAKEKARFYRMAKRSCTECAAILDHLVDTGMTTEDRTTPIRTLARRITGALVRLIQSTERRTAPPPGPPTPRRATPHP
jgi:four helix bundle protein